MPGDALAVCTGWGAREWWALRPSDGNLKTRTLGLVSSIAAGIALALPHRKVIAIDGDGAFFMNLCGLPTIAWQSPPDFIHLLFDNECSEELLRRHRDGFPRGRRRGSRPEAPVTGMRPGSRRRQNSALSSSKP